MAFLVDGPNATCITDNLQMVEVETALKFGIFTHPKRPKVPVERILRQLRSAGISYSQQDPDIAIVVGGDGTFGYFGRILSIPLLFVGLQESGVVGSKARLAEAYYSGLVRALNEIRDGKYCVVEKEMISVCLKRHSVDVLTDVYLDRGIFAGCLRYAVTVIPHSHGKMKRFIDYAIGNGVIVSTSFGAGGYFSYPDRLRSAAREKLDSGRFREDRIGICHIIPAHLERKRKGIFSRSDLIRYSVPQSSSIQIRLLRDANARLYGTTAHSKGIRVRLGDMIRVTSANRTAKIIKLRN